MSGGRYTPPRPTEAIVLSIVASVFMLADGLVLEYLSGTVNSLGFTNFGGALGWLGILELVFGLAILSLSISLLRRPEACEGRGLASVILSVLSIVGGGGFGVGLVLGVIGGVLVNQFDPDAGRPWHGSPVGVGWTPSWSPGPASSQPGPNAPLVWSSLTTCPRCRWSGQFAASFCPRCWARLV